MGNKVKSEMTPEELERREEEEFNTGPLSVLTQSVKNNTQVLINCRNNKNSSAELKLLTGIATWFWRVLRRCGPKCPRQAKGKRRPSPSTRTDLSAKCSCVVTPSSLSSEIPWRPANNRKFMAFLYLVLAPHFSHFFSNLYKTTKAMALLR